MPQGDKSAYTDKQKRQARHIEESYEKRGRSRKTAERAAWATVNKQDGGGKKKTSTRTGTKTAKKTAKRTAKKAGKTTTSRSAKKSSAKSTAKKRGSSRKRVSRR